MEKENASYQHFLLSYSFQSFLPQGCKKVVKRHELSGKKLKVLILYLEIFWNKFYRTFLALLNPNVSTFSGCRVVGLCLAEIKRWGQQAGFVRCSIWTWNISTMSSRSKELSKFVWVSYHTSATFIGIITRMLTLSCLSCWL